MPREVRKKTFYTNLPKSFIRQRSRSLYNLRPRNKLVNYNDARSYRLKSSFQDLQLDLTESSSSKKSSNDEPVEIVTHFVNANFSENSFVKSTESQDPLHQKDDLEDCIKSKNQEDDQYEEHEKTINPVEDISRDAMNQKEYATECLEEVEEEYCCSADNIEEEGLIAANVSYNEENIHTTLEEEAEDEAVQNSNSANNIERDELIPENHSEETFSSDTEEGNELTNLYETEEVEETEDNTNDLNNDEEDFQPNYPASAIAHRELLGNPAMFNLARWASQARVQNDTDPYLVDYDIDAMGDGPHIQPNILEIHVSIFQEDEDEP